MALAGPQSETEICNAALALLGVDERLADVETDTGANARRCRLAYPRARDSLLTAFPWNFAGTRASLPAMEAAPAWGFARGFLLPADFLRLRAVRGAETGAPYVIEHHEEGSILLCDFEAPLDILYTARVMAVGRYDALFIDALTARLAAELAMPVTQTRTIFQTMVALSQQRLEEAQIADSREGTAGDALPQGSWIAAREGGGA